MEFSVYWNPPDDIVAMTHGGQIPMTPVPAGIQTLAEPAIAKQLVMVAKARDSAGDVIGTLTEMEVFSDSDAFEVYLTLVIPGRGMLATYQTKSQSTLLEPFAKALATGKPWNGEMGVVMTTGPVADKRGCVIAATGAFAGMTGAHQQSVTFYTITPTGSVSRVCERFMLHKAS